MPAGINLSPQVSPRMLAELERLGRKLGIPLQTLELLGQNAKVARQFIVMARAGRGAEYLASLNLQHLARLLESRERGFAFHVAGVPSGVAPVA